MQATCRLQAPHDTRFQGRIPVVLDGVVGAARDELRDLGPFVADAVVRLHDNVVFLFSPRLLADRRVEVVVPALTALYSGGATRSIPASITGGKQGQGERERACLPMRPGSLEAMSDQRFAPYCRTSAESCSSSCVLHGPLTGGTDALRIACMASCSSRSSSGSCSGGRSTASSRRFMGIRELPPPERLRSRGALLPERRLLGPRHLAGFSARGTSARGFSGALLPTRSRVRTA